MSTQNGREQRRTPGEIRAATNDILICANNEADKILYQEPEASWPFTWKTDPYNGTANDRANCFNCLH